MTTPNYRAKVADVFAGRSAEPVFNGSVEHAKVVVEEGFKAAERRVLMLTTRLNPACYGEPAVLAAMTAFLSKPDTELEILVEDPTAMDTAAEVIGPLKGVGGDRVRIDALPPEVARTYGYNFLIVDDKGFRFEPDRLDHVAVVAGGPENVARLRKLESIFVTLKSAVSAQLVPA